MDKLKKVAVLPIAVVAFALLLVVIVPAIALIVLSVGILKCMLPLVNRLTAETKRKALD